MVGRWSLFKLFMIDLTSVRIRASFCSDLSDGIVQDSTPDESNDEIANEAPFDLSSTKSHRLFERLITTYYTPLELHYLCSIIDKVTHSAPHRAENYSEIHDRLIFCLNLIEQMGR